MPIEIISNSALFKRAEQLKRWEDSETNNVSPVTPKNKKSKIKFSDSCIFLAACAKSDTEEVESFLELGTDINTANVDGLTALHQACIDNNLEMVQFLVEQGCDINRGDNEGWTPLHATATCGFISIAKYLIENGANVAAVNNDGDLPIDIAESTEMEEYLSDVLDEQGIDCDTVRSEEERVMLEDAKQMLNSHEFQDKMHPCTGASSLHVAAAKGYIEVMNILIKLGADLSAQDNDGWTPLHAAAHWGQKEACAVLADNLADMDIKNLADQTCFDVAEPDLVKLLEELKKQATMQNDRPEIQAILLKTSNKPPLKRRTSVTRMSNEEKSKSVMKDTKNERVQIENLTLPEDEIEEEKERIQGEALRQQKSSSASEKEAIEEKEIHPMKTVGFGLTPPIESIKKQEVSKVPLWQEDLRQSSETLESQSSVNEPTTPSTPTDTSTEFGSYEKRRPFISPVRDEESESQRKVHAKRVRETRRSTQGVLLEDIKSAELQFNTKREATKKLAEEATFDLLDSGGKDKDKTVKESSLVQNTSPKSKRQSLESGDCEESKIEKTISSKDSATRVDEPFVTLVLGSKAGSSPEDISPSDNRAALGTPAAKQRRKKPKRRCTGVVCLDSDEGQEEKENEINSDQRSELEAKPTERTKHHYGSSTSLQDAVSEASQRETPSRYYSLGSRTSLNDDNKDYKKLYEEVVKQNEKLKETLKTTEEELERTKNQLLKLPQNNLNKNSISDAEKRERRALERKFSEMEEELKLEPQLKKDNYRLKEENGALIRVISKLSR